MKERNIRMRFGVGGLTKPMCDLLINGQVDALLDTQDFDLAAVESVKDLHHSGSVQVSMRTRSTRVQLSINWIS